MSLTGTGIQIGNATQFDASINIPRGLATDGTTVWLISIDKAHTLDMDDGTAEAIDDSIVRFGASIEARAATYHDNKVLVSGYAGGVLSVYALDVATGLLAEWLTAALHYDDPSITGTPDIHGIASLNGTLYALDRAQDGLFTLVRDGSLVKVGTLTAGFGINALNARSLTVYRGGLIASDATLDKIFSLSHTTGAGTIISATNLFPEPQPQALLEFDGKLYVAGSFHDALFRLYDVRWDDSIEDLAVYTGQSARWTLPTLSQDAESFSLLGTPPSWLSVAALDLVAATAPTVTSDTNYDVNVRATLDGINADKTLRVVVKIPTVPDARQNLTATAQADGTSMLLAWEAADNGGRPLTDHEVSSDGGTTWVSTGSTATSYTVTALAKGTAYDFQVRAVNAEGSGAASATVAETTETTIPGASTDLTATAQSGGRSVQLDFDAAADDGGTPITAIEYRYAEGTAIGSSVAWVSTGSTATSIVVTGLSRATQYTFEVREVNSKGAGPASDTATVTTEAPPAVTISTTPAGPFTGGATITANFEWDAVVTGFTTADFVVYDSLGHYYTVGNFTGTGQAYACTVTLLNRTATLTIEVLVDRVDQGNLRTAVTRSIQLGPPIIAAIDEQFITINTTDYVLEIPISGSPTRAYADGDMEGFYQNWVSARGVLQIKSDAVTRLISGATWNIVAIRGSHTVRSTIRYNVVPAAPIFTNPGAQKIYKGGQFLLDIDIANAPTVARGSSLLAGLKYEPSQRSDGTQGVLTKGLLPKDANLTESTFTATYHTENDGGSDDLTVPFTIETHTGVYLFKLFTDDLMKIGPDAATLHWTYFAPNVTREYDSPVVTADGIYLFADGNDDLLKVSPEGSLLWRFDDATRGTYNSIVATENGVYVSRSGQTYKVNVVTGALIWSNTNSYSHSSFSDDHVYLAHSTSRKLYKLDVDTGQILWTYTWPRNVRSFRGFRAFGDDLYVLETTALKKINSTDGSVVWTYDITPFSTAYAFRGADATGVYIVNSSRRTALKINRDGTLAWTFNIPSSNHSSRLESDGLYFFSTNADELLKVNLSTGVQDWAYTAPPSTHLILVRYYKDYIYLGTGSPEKIIKLNKSTGTAAWTITQDVRTPHLVEDGSDIYVMTDSVTNREILKIRGSDGSVLWRYSLPTGNYTGLAVA